MNSNTRKTAVSFFFDEKDGGKFTLSIVVENLGVTDRYALHGTVTRQLGIVTLDELEHSMPEGTRLSDLFQATVLRVTSLYTGYALRKFHIANELVKYFSEYTISDVPNEYNLPAVKVKETLEASKAAAEVFDVTCTNMYAILTHDPEDVTFQEEWMDTTTQMMLNAVFEIPKMWTSNINASGMVVRDSQTEWVWNYSPSTEILIIHVRDRANKKHSQWEVTKELAIHFTGNDRENGTHYRSFINHEGGRQWHVTRKVVIQRAFITELPAGTTRGVFKQIKHILQVLQDRATCKIGETTFTPNYLLWLPMTSLEEAWRGADGKLPIEPPAALREAYLRLVFHYDNTLPKYNAPDGSSGPARSQEVVEAMYELLAPRYGSGESQAARFSKFWAQFDIDLEKLRTDMAAKFEGDRASNKYDVFVTINTSNILQNLMTFKSEVKEKENQEDENIGH
jgi:hypothetical protein